MNGQIMKNRQFAFGALLSYGAIAFNILSGLLYTPWMIRVVGDDQYALYALAISVINLFLLDFGIGSSVTKFLSNYYARGQYKEANRFMGIVYKVFFVISVVIAVVLLVFYFLIDGIYVKLTPTEIQTFKRLFVIVATYSVLSFPFTTFNGILMANEQFISVKACNFGQKVLNVALIVVALLMGANVYALVLVNALSNILFIGIKYICIRRQTRLAVDFSHRDKTMAKELFGFSVWVTVMNLARRCMFNIMPSVIAALIGSAEVTRFSLAASLEGYVYTFADAINGMFLPKISRILVREDAERGLSALMCKVGRFHVATIGLIYLGFLCLGREFVLLWMGEGYELVYICTLLLISPALIYIPQQVAKTALLAKGIVKQQAMIYVGMAVANLSLSFILIPMFGIVGAAISVCVSYLLRTLMFNVLYRKKLGIDLGVYFRNAYGRWLVAAVAALAFGWMVAKIPGLTGWVGLAVKIVLFTGIYGTFFIVFGVEKIERAALLERLHGGKKT